MNDYDKASRYLVKRARDRANLGSLALVLSTLGGCRSDWERGLRGWNMKTSPFLDEIRAESREEGREEGRVEEVRALVLRQGRRKFGTAPSRKQQKALKAITDLGQLEALAERLLDVDSWAELLGGG
jgi:predicted transposase YdaD